MTLPASWTQVPVVGSFIDLHGNPCRGRITFTSNQVVVIDGKTVVPKVITAVLVAGSLPDDFVLPSTNDADLSPVGWAYQVREHFDGGRSYGIAVPYGASSIDLATVAPVVQPEAQATVLQIQLAGLSTSTGGVITEADTLLTAAGKLQAQVTTNLATLTGHTGNTSNPHSVTAVQVGADPTGTAAAAIGVHEAAGDPHPQYTSAGEAAAAAPVQSVSGRTGDVTLTSSDVGLGNVNNTSDVDKPVSTAAQTALDLKAPIASPTFTGTVAGITKSMVGLGNVDNVSDAGKPVSTATQTALNLKAPLASPAFTGTPTGISKTHVGLANVDNTSDANKPVSTAQAAAISAVSASIAATLWVTGSTYTANVVRYSPTDYQAYRDTVGGLSSTDPASDTTGRWQSAMLPSAEAIALPDLLPTAVFNFAGGVIDRRFVQSRTTPKYRYNSFGNFEALPAGVSQVDFDPATKRCRGYKAEPATTYLAMRSSGLDNGSYWTAVNVTVTPSAAIGIYGTASAYKVEATSTAVTAFAKFVVASATQQYVTVAARKGSGSTDCNAFVVRNETSSVILASLTLNYDTLAITQSVGVGATATLGNHGFLNVRIPVPGVTIGNALGVYLGFVGGVATAGKFAYFDTPTVSNQPNATPYPTDGVNVPNVADCLRLDLTAHTAIINPLQHTIVVAFDGSTIPAAASDHMLVNLSGSAGAEQVRIKVNTGVVYAEAVTGGVTVASLNLGAVIAGRNVVAFSVAADNFAAVARGGAVATDTSGAMPAVTTLGVGCNPSSAGSEPSACIDVLAPFPRACTAGELRAFVNNY